MQVGDLVKCIKPFADDKMGIILRPCTKHPQACLNDLWLVHWFDDNPFDEQVYDYDLALVNG